MRHEVIVKRPDGTRYKIIVRFSIDFRSEPTYRYDVEVAEKGKRKFHGIVDEDNWKYRHLSMEARTKFREESYLQHVTPIEVLDAKLELWNFLSPTD